MPLRVSCPSCAAALNLRDDLVGKRVRCPQCKTIMPPVEAEPIEVDVVESEPAPRRRAADTDDRPARVPPHKSLLTWMIVYWVVAVVLSVVLGTTGSAPAGGDGGAAAGLVPPTNRATAKPPEPPAVATLENYQQITSASTRRELEDKFGLGQIPTGNELHSELGGNAGDQSKWTKLANAGRVLMWKSKSARLIVAFYPHGAPGDQMQAKRLFVSGQPAQFEGELDDETFARANGLEFTGEPRNNPNAAAPTYTAEALAKEYAADPKKAGFKFDRLWVFVEGTVKTVLPDTYSPTVNGVCVELGGGAVPVRVSVNAQWLSGARGLAPGAKAKFKAKCAGALGGGVVLDDARLESGSGTVDVNAVAMVSAYTASPEKGDAAYKGKGVNLTGGVVEGRDKDGALWVSGSKSINARFRVKVLCAAEWNDDFDKFKVGAPVYVVGLCTGAENGVITITGAWPRR